MPLCVGPPHIVHIVSSYQLIIFFPCYLNKPLVDDGLFGNAVVLNFKEKVFLSEYVPVEARP